MQLLIRHTRGATVDGYQAHALLRRLYCEAVPDVNMHCGLREIDSMNSTPDTVSENGGMTRH